jgi:site-specific recombinase
MTDRLPHGFPDLEGFGRALAPSDARHRAIRALYSILASMRVDDPLEPREIAFERLAKWIRDTGRAPTVETASLHDGPEGKRLRMIAQAMRSFPAVRLHLGRMVQVMLRDKSAQSFLAKMGVPGDRGFSGEIVDRLSARLIPEPTDEQELAQAARAHVPFRCAPRPLDAILLLASRVSAAGLSDDIRARSPATTLQASPFFRLPRILDALMATRRADHDAVESFAEACHAGIAECRAACAAVLDHLEQTGVSVDVVYRLDLIARSLNRIDVLLSVLVPRDRLVMAEARDEAPRAPALGAPPRVEPARHRGHQHLPARA